MVQPAGCKSSKSNDKVKIKDKKVKRKKKPYKMVFLVKDLAPLEEVDPVVRPPPTVEMYETLYK